MAVVIDYLLDLLN